MHRKFLRCLICVILIVTVLCTMALDWPTYLHGVQRSGATDETILSTSNASRLTLLWSHKTGGPIAAQPIVVGSVAYVGSWDGYEYALDVTTGAVKWKTYLGVTTTTVPRCGPTPIGVTSSATVQNGVVYVGGGDTSWYALDAMTGKVLWTVYTGDNSATEGYYNWASPLLYHGFAYIGIASLGDCPLVEGELLQVDVRTHVVVHTFSMGTGNVGGGIWTSPSLDMATNTLYMTTGSIVSYATQPYAQAIVALDASSLALKGVWQLPPAQAMNDADWGTTPILFDVAGGRHVVAAANKNGFMYAFDRTRLAAGPLWHERIAAGGGCPTCGAGSVSSPAWGAGRLYVASGNTRINGLKYAGSVRALDPTTGRFLWQHGTNGIVLGALTYAHGLVIAGAGAVLEVLDAATGKQLFAYTTGNAIYGPASVSNGRIYATSTDGSVYAFGLSGTTSSLPPGAIDLTSQVNNVGISSDRNPGSADFDGAGYTSYSASALRAAGFTAGKNVTVDGSVFAWPGAAAGQIDNVVAHGQTVWVPPSTSGTTLSFLGSADNAPAAGSTGGGTITYRDGTHQSFRLSFSDWSLVGGSATPIKADRVAARTAYRNTGGSRLAIPAYVFCTSVALQAGKTVTSITLPARTNNAGRLHIFAMSIGG